MGHVSVWDAADGTTASSGWAEHQGRLVDEWSGSPDGRRLDPTVVGGRRAGCYSCGDAHSGGAAWPPCKGWRVCLMQCWYPVGGSAHQGGVARLRCVGPAERRGACGCGEANQGRWQAIKVSHEGAGSPVRDDGAIRTLGVHSGNTCATLRRAGLRAPQYHRHPGSDRGPKASLRAPGGP